ncbi:MAG: addiction module protein [Planctomycetes bacterium]|nr:addiction module protein [Planctomycetota bacterium]
MTAEGRAILEKALGLDSIQRAELIEALFRSFDQTGDRRTEILWASEAENRVDACDAGKLRADPADVVLGRISKR